MPHYCLQQGAMAKMENEIKTISKHMDEQTRISNAVYELTAEVRVMNERMTTLTEAQAAMRADLEEMKATPKNRWNTLITGAISAIVGGSIRRRAPNRVPLCLPRIQRHLPRL